MSNFQNVEAEGRTSFTGGRYVEFTRSGHSVLMPLESCVDFQRVSHKLAAAGILMSGRDGRERIDYLLAQVREFPAAPLQDRVGWCGLHYGTSDGRIVSPDGGHDVVGIYAPSSSARVRNDDGRAWQQSVVAPIQGQNLCVFALCLALVPQILDIVGSRRGLIIEIAGAAGTGKTTLQRLSASVSRHTDPVPKPFGSIMADPIEAAAGHADHLLLLADPAYALAGLTGPRFAAQVRDAILALSDGSRGQGGKIGLSVTLIRSREPLLEQVGAESAVGRIITDRVITFSINDRDLGIFDHVPSGYPSASAFADAVTAATETAYGAAGGRYLRLLVDERARDESGLRQRMDKHLKAFQRRCGVDPNQGIDVRAAQAFALVYAAGRLAQGYGILPVTLKIGPAILACYHLHRAANATPLTGYAALREIAEQEEVVHLDADPEPSAEVVQAADILVRRREGYRVLLVRDRARQRIWPRWHAKVPPNDIEPLLVRDGDHLSTQRRLGGRKVRVYEFHVPDGPEAQGLRSSGCRVAAV